MSRFKQLYNQEFESSSTATPQWKTFYRVACNYFKKELAGIAHNIQMSRGHFYFSGFFTATKTGQIWYFSIGDVRYFPDKQLLIRKAQSYKDYSGGSNQYLPINENLPKMIKTLIEE